MNLTNNKNSKYKLENTMITGRDTYKLSEEIIKDKILNHLYNGNQEKELTILITENSNLSDCIFSYSIINKKGVSYYNLSDGFYNDFITYNPLYGDENYTINKISDLILDNNVLSDNYTKELHHHTLAYSIKVIKRLFGHQATLLNLYTLLNNTSGEGKKMVMNFSKMPVENPSIARENSAIANWLLNDYYSGLSGERYATNTFQYCSYLRHRIHNLLNDCYCNSFLNQYCQYPIYLSEDVIIINLKSLCNFDSKIFSINSMLSDIIKDSPNIKKTIYSDLDLNLDFNNYYKNLIKNSKKLNISCFNCVQDFSSCLTDLSGYIDNFIISDNLSINDSIYFDSFSGNDLVQKLSEYKINDNAYIDDFNKANKVISKYYKDRLRGHVLYSLNREEKKKSNELNKIVSDTFSILKKWNSFYYFEDFSFNKALANHLWSMDIDEAKKVKSIISSICELPRVSDLDNIIKFENGYIYDKDYQYLERSKKIKVKDIKNLRDLRLRLMYLENILDTAKTLGLKGYSCRDEIETSICKFKIMYYDKLCVDCSMTFDEINSKFNTKKEIELRNKEDNLIKEAENSKYLLSKFNDFDSNDEEFDIFNIIIDDDEDI